MNHSVPPGSRRQNASSAPALRFGVLHLILTGIAITLGVFAAAVIGIRHIAGGVELLASRDLENTRHVAAIVFYDEVLTMSARLAAATGERAWIDRYHSFEPKLLAALERSQSLAPDAYALAATDETRLANEALVSMELEAFRLVRQGQREAAYELLSSPEYLHKKSVYAAGMEAAESAITRSVEGRSRELLTWLDASRTISVAALLTLSLAWICLLSMARRMLADQRQSEQDLAAARDRAEAAMHAKAEFLANMSHEIRTPLNGVIGMNELMCGTHLDETQLQYADNIRVSSEALLHVIDDVLDYSKIDAGKLEIEATPFDLTTRIEDIVALIAPRTVTKRIELLVEMDTRLPPQVIGDPGRLGQVLLNLLGNAAKFTFAGEVRLTVEPLQTGALGPAQPLWIRFEIADSGIGIPPERLPKLFAPFEQVDASTTRRFGGTGLGLAITRRLVELMGGRVSVESRLGIGSRFRVELPLPALPHSAASACAPSVVPAGLPVLLVDDHPEARSILLGQLRALGAVAEGLESGEALLERLRLAAPAERPALVMLDLHLGGIDGIETARRLRALPGLDDLPIVLFSADPQGAEAEEVGIAARLLKPIRRRVLERTLARLASLGGQLAKSAPRAETPAVPTGLAGRRVLVAEDNPINQRVVGALLERAGIDVRLANDGRQALELESQGTFDLILMDCQMPILDGYEATRSIRQRARQLGRPAVPILALTAHALEGELERCLEAGMDGYLTKPIRSAALYAALLEQLSGRPPHGAESRRAA
jgi:signal transduction histidine kinase/CheY-like chemotaxis protein